MGEWNGKFRISEFQLIPLSKEINMFINISPGYNKFSASILYRILDKVTINLLNLSLALYIRKRKIKIKKYHIYTLVVYWPILNSNIKRIDIFIGTGILNIVVYRKYLSVIENSIRLGVFTGNVTERIRYTLDII